MNQAPRGLSANVPQRQLPRLSDKGYVTYGGPDAGTDGREDVGKDSLPQWLWWCPLGLSVFHRASQAVKIP